MSNIDQIIADIDARIALLLKDIAPLEAARDALDGKNSPRRGRKPGGRPPTRGRPAERARSAQPANARRVRPKPTKRTAVVAAGQLELLLASSDGLTTRALAEQANGERAQVLRLLREMERAGNVRRTGERRGTRWHLITDEDRIQARAAELEAQRQRA
jgi:hypothetical protein